MGVDYRVWVIPQARGFRPSAEQVAKLANALRDEGWVPKVAAKGQRSQVLELLPSDDAMGKKPVRSEPFGADPFSAGWVEFHSEHELLLDWHVQDMQEAGVQYPFAFNPYPDSVPYFYVRLILGDEYFYWTGENVMEFEAPATQCTCGKQMARWTGWAHGAPSHRIHRLCPKCGREFDLSGIACDVLDGWTGERQRLAGGLTFRFALVVDCHKYWPREEEAGRRFNLRPEFLDLWRDHIGVPFEIVVTAD